MFYGYGYIIENTGGSNEQGKQPCNYCLQISTYKECQHLWIYDRSYTHKLSSCEIKPEKNSALNWIWIYALWATGAVLCQLSYQAIWELVLCEFIIYPYSRWWGMQMNTWKIMFELQRKKLWKCQKLNPFCTNPLIKNFETSRWQKQNMNRTYSM